MSEHLTNLVNFLMTHGYLILFLITSIESYVVNVAAGVVSHLQHFNIYLVILISIFADLIPNVIYYYIGKRSANYLEKKDLFEKYKKKVAKSRLRHINLQKLSDTNPVKALLIAKFFGPPTLILIGSIGMDFRKYLKYNLIITFIKTNLLILLGYFSVNSYLYLNQLLNSN